MFSSASSFFLFCYFFQIEIILSTPFQKFTKAAIQQLKNILLYMYIYIYRHTYTHTHTHTHIHKIIYSFVNTQETFQRCLNVVARVIWRCDAGECQINVETKFCMLSFKFTTLKNVKLTLSISLLVLTT